MDAFVDYEHQMLSALHRLLRLVSGRALFIQLPRAEFFLLRSISQLCEKSSGVTITQLANQTGARLPAISKLLNTIEQKGYIDRLSDPSDRRICRICLTQKGNDLLAQAQQEHQQRMQQILSSLGDEDAQQLIRLMWRLCEVLEDLPLLESCPMKAPEIERSLEG